MVNCLTYALHFWKSCPKYKILYNSYHVINVPEYVGAEGFLPLESFGYDHLVSSFGDLLSNEDKEILKEYMNIEQESVLMKQRISSFEEYLQYEVGATYNLDEMISNLTIEDVAEEIRRYTIAVLNAYTHSDNSVEDWVSKNLK